jgi:hypothetical protein
MPYCANNPANSATTDSGEKGERTSLDLAQPVRQWVPTGENVGHHQSVLSAQSVAMANRPTANRNRIAA